MIFNWWTANFETRFKIDTYEVIFGIPNERGDITISQLNYLILLGKYYIYARKKKDKPLEVYDFLLECKNRLNIKKEIFFAAGREKDFNNTWEPLLNQF